jgi:hypothetical protein
LVGYVTDMHSKCVIIDMVEIMPIRLSTITFKKDDRKNEATKTDREACIAPLRSIVFDVLYIGSLSKSVFKTMFSSINV